RDPPLLRYADELEQRAHEQAGALVEAIAGRTGAQVLLLDDPVDQRIALAPGTPILGGDVLVDITGSDPALPKDLLLLCLRQRRFGAAQRPAGQELAQ